MQRLQYRPGTGVRSLPDVTAMPRPHTRHALAELAVDAVPGAGPGPARRLLDITAALAGLLLLWPALICVGVAVRQSTGGTAIYRQRRVGQGGVPFTLLKFRTMRASSAGGPEVTAPGDQRVTRLGAVLRRTSADELPQLVNILLGNMTLVGPRPESVPLARRYPPECRFIFRYRPGLTGPSQVMVHDEQALVPATDVEQCYLDELVPRRVGIDMEFLRNPTLGFTVRWLVRTALYLIRPATAAAGSAAASHGPAVSQM